MRPLTHASPLILRSLMLLLAATVATTAGAADVLRLDADTAARLAAVASPLADRADARIDAVTGRVAAADAEQKPTITLDAQVAHRSSVPEFSAPIGGPDQPPTVIFPNIQNTYGVGVTVAQLLYSGGQVNAHRQSARSEHQAAFADRDALLIDLETRGRVAFWRATAANAEVHAATAEVDRARRLLEDAEALLDAGMAVVADGLAAEGRLASAEVRRIRSIADRDTAMAELRSLLGIEASTPLELIDNKNRPERPQPLPELLEQARLERTELQAAALRIEASGERLQAVKAAHKPAIQALAGWDLDRPNVRYMPMTDSWNDSWFVGIGATWRVFDGDRTAAKEATANAETAALAADARELARQVDLEVEEARAVLESAIEMISAAEAARRAGIAREEAERDRYQAGLAPISNVLDAQAELATADKELIGSRASAWIAAALLERAIGG